MQIFSHIDVQLLLNDNNVWVHRELKAKYLLIVVFNSDYVLKMESRPIVLCERPTHLFPNSTI
jgi:hypothetical protein